MNKKLLTLIAVSFLTSAIPAWAQTDKDRYYFPGGSPATANNADTPDRRATTGDNEKPSLDKITGAADNGPGKERVALIGGETEGVNYITVDSRATAKGLIDKPLYSSEGKAVGTVKDIILNRDGSARTVVVSHGGFLGFGRKMSALDYGSVMRQAAGGDMVIPLSAEKMSTAQAFSYNSSDTGKAGAVSANIISIRELLKGSLSNDNGVVVGWMDNVHFNKGQADHVVFAYDRSRRLDGQKIAFDYTALNLSRIEGKYRFKMDQKQSLQFDTFRKMAMN